MKTYGSDLDLNEIFVNLKSQKKFNSIQLHFFNQKGLVTSIGLHKYFSGISIPEKAFNAEKSIILDLKDSISSSEAKKFEFQSHRYAWFSFIHFEQKKI